jgi:hypothetical protein
MACKDNGGVMRGLMHAMKTMTGKSVEIHGMETFEELSCALMEVVCLALFQMWKKKEFGQAEDFSDLLNLFNDRILTLAGSEMKQLLALREEINVELNVPEK